MELYPGFSQQQILKSTVRVLCLKRLLIAVDTHEDLGTFNLNNEPSERPKIIDLNTLI